MYTWSTFVFVLFPFFFSKCCFIFHERFHFFIRINPFTYTEPQSEPSIWSKYEYNSMTGVQTMMLQSSMLDIMPGGLLSVVFYDLMPLLESIVNSVICLILQEIFNIWKLLKLLTRQCCLKQKRWLLLVTGSENK